jgi:hypothetical protein
MARTATLPPATLADAEPQLQVGYAPSDIRTDAVAYLPVAAADKLRALRERSSERHAATIPFSEIQDASVTRQQAETRLKRLLAHPAENGFGLDPGDPRCVAAQALVDRTTADLRRLNERAASLTAAWHAVSQALSACEAWIKNGIPGNVTLEDYDGPEVKLTKNENGLLDAIEKRRVKVKGLHADLSRIRAAPYPKTYAKQRMRSEIAALAQRGAVNVTPLINHDGKLVFPEDRRSIPVIVGKEAGIAAWQEFDALATFCWLHQVALAEKLDREIDALAIKGESISHEVRQKREAEIMADILSVDREISFLALLNLEWVKRRVG